MRTQVRVGGAALLLCASGCGVAAAGEPETSQVRFAQVSGDVSVSGDSEASVNLIVAAPVGDPVWSHIHEVVVVNDAADGGDLVFGKDSFTVHPGTKQEGMQVGSIPVPIPAEVGEFELTTVDVVFSEGDDPVTYDVGEWHMARSDADPTGDDETFTIVDGYPASVASCGEVTLTLQRAGGSEAVITDVQTDAPSLTIRDVVIDMDGSGAVTISYDLTCDTTYDVFAYTPSLLVTEDGRTSSVPLDQMLVGYLDMTEETVQRILAR